VDIAGSSIISTGMIANIENLAMGKILDFGMQQFSSLNTSMINMKALDLSAFFHVFVATTCCFF
jgi:hypothetical protein